MNLELNGKTVVLGITGSIAAYKAADVVSALVKLGADVFPVMTESATKFITPMTLQTLSGNRVVYDLWDEANEHECSHIDLADKADLMVVAPATANIIACFANGLAPDLLTSVYLATKAPVMIAPAMNTKMLEHPATQENLKRLKERGHSFIEPVEGMLACGYEGNGKLAPVDVVVDAVRSALL